MDQTNIKQYHELLIQHLNNTPFAVIEWDPVLHIISWSKQAERIFGWPEEEVVGKLFNDFPLVYKDDLSQINTITHQFINGAIEGSTTRNRNNTKDGRCIHCVWYNSAIKDENGKVISILSLVQDITENIQKEEELRKINHRFSFISNATNDGIWEWEVAENKVWVNDAYCKTFGYNPQEYEDFYNEWLKRIYPADKEQFLENISEAQKNKEQQWSGEFKFLLADGTYGNILQRAFFIYDDKGNINKVVGIDLNITRLRKTEAALSDSEKRFRKIFELSPVAISISRKIDAMIFDTNKAFCSMLGFQKNKLLGKSLVDVGSITLENFEAIQSLRAKTQSIKDYQLELKTNDGELIQCLLYSETIEIDGEQYCINIIQDITQELLAVEMLKANERQLQQIYNSVNDIIFLIDVIQIGIYKFKSVNQSFLNATGIQIGDVVGKSVTEVIPEPSLNLVLNNYRKSIETKGPVQWQEVTHFPSGEKTGIVTVTPIFNDEGVCTQLVGSVHDITEIKATQDALNKSYEEIRLLASHLQQIREEERGFIAREIHDELGQLLTGLKMEISWLKKIDKLIPEQINVRVSNITSMLDNAINTVRNISSELRPHMLDDLGLAEALKWQCNQFEKRTGIKVHFIDDKKEIKLSKEKSTAFYRIVQEALTNIARHSLAHEVWVTLKMKSRLVTLNIKDNGKGFMMDNVKTFESLGLLGMKERMHAVGGTFKIDSNPGKGTIIEVSFSDK